MIGVDMHNTKPSSDTSLTANDEKAIVAFRRLLLSKQLYLHGLDHSAKAGALNKMIAIHNFHNAIEIALRAISLHYEIRTEKQLNIEFEVMLNEIDRHKDFREREIRLPYRQELRNLNQLRNLVQHHAVEPESATMDDWRVFSRRFLARVCREYFGLDFNSLSSVDMIHHNVFREMLRTSLSCIQGGDVKSILKGVIIAKLVFQWSSFALLDFLPEEEQEAVRAAMSHTDHDEIVSDEAVQTTASSLHEEQSEIVHSELFCRGLQLPIKAKRTAERALYYSVLISSGISLMDYRRLELSTPSSVGCMINGNLGVRWGKGKQKPDETEAQWIHSFVVDTMVHWQVLGSEFEVPDYAGWGEWAARKLIEGYEDFIYLHDTSSYLDGRIRTSLLDDRWTKGLPDAGDNVVTKWLNE
jgi:hypothetical protein